MIALYIIGTIFLLLLAILLLPLKVKISFCEEFSFKVKFLFFTVYKPKEKPIENKKSTKKEPPKKTESMFSELKSKNGFVGAVKEIFKLFSDSLQHIKFLLRFIKFKNIKLNLNVASTDAAGTAIQYGAVCSVVYPVLSFFESIANVKYKNINIKSDFDSKESRFDFSLDISLQLLFLLLSGFKIYKEYKKFSVRNDLQ